MSDGSALRLLVVCVSNLSRIAEDWVSSSEREGACCRAIMSGFTFERISLGLGKNGASTRPCIQNRGMIGFGSSVKSYRR
jgi:hypothetical protein